MQPESYKVAMVIPSFDERYGPLQMLESIALQKGIRDTRLVCIVVINNARTAGLDVRKANFETRCLIESLWRQKMPDDIHGNDSVYPNSRELRFKAWETVAAAPYTIMMLDMHSVDHAPAGCNVGMLVMLAV